MVTDTASERAAGSAPATVAVARPAFRPGPDGVNSWTVATEAWAPPPKISS